MKAVRLLPASIAALALLLPHVPAGATTVSECQRLIEALRGETQGAELAEKDSSGLLGKLDNASVKLDQLKRADAVAKLTDYRDRVTSLGADGKMDGADAAGLVADANAAIACIQAIGQ